MAHEGQMSVQNQRKIPLHSQAKSAAKSPTPPPPRRANAAAGWPRPRGMAKNFPSQQCHIDWKRRLSFFASFAGEVAENHSSLSAIHSARDWALIKTITPATNKRLQNTASRTLKDSC